MNTIEIYINNFGNETNILINIDNSLITINNKTKKIDKEKISDLIRIIRTWNNEYPGDDKLIDSEKFKIAIKMKDEIDMITGNGSYPENYNNFKKWIDIINE